MLTYHEILSLDDEKYDDWLDLYQTAFPLTEQVRISDLNQVLRAKQDGTDATSHFLIALDDDGGTAALLWYDDDTGCGAAVLWYIAVVPDRRSKGTGSQVYQEVRRRVSRQVGTRALLMEVEDPEACHSEEDRRLAVRRIEFYRRLGAKRLGGITYLQSVGWQPPIPMHLMADVIEEQSAAETLALAQCVFGDALQVVSAPEML